MKIMHTPIKVNEEDIQLFEEEHHHENTTRNQEEEEEGPTEPIKPISILEMKKRKKWLKSALDYAEENGATKGYFIERKIHKRYSRYATYLKKLIEVKPNTFEDIAHQEEWKKVMLEEYESIMKNGVWEIPPRPSDKSTVTSKWIYKIKHVIDGIIDKYKARSIVSDFSQMEGIGYEETFSPTSRYTTIYTLKN